MFKVVTATLIVLIVVALFLMVKVKRYGSLSAAFSKNLKNEREELAAARHEASRLRRERERELWRARSEVDRLTEELEALLEPGSGKQVAKVGPVTAREHVLEIHGAVMPLDGMRVRIDTRGALINFAFLDKTGLEAAASFDTAVRQVGVDHRQKQVGDRTVVESVPRTRQDYTPEKVQSFAVTLQKLIDAETRFVAALPDLIQATRTALKAAVADEGRIAESSETATALDAAQKRLESVEQAWEDARGRQRAATTT